MTLVVQVARGAGVQMLATDTRTRWRALPGFDGPVSAICEKGKLVPLAGGFGAGAGSAEWSTGALDALAAVPRLSRELVRAQLADYADHTINTLDADLAEHVREHNHLWLIGPTGPLALDWRGNDLWPGRALTVTSSGPPDLEPRTLQLLVDGLRDDVRRAPTVAALVDAVRAYAAEVAARSEAVSGYLSVGIVHRDGTCEYRPAAIPADGKRGAPNSIELGAPVAAFDDEKFTVIATDVEGQDINADLFVKLENAVKVGTTASPDVILREIRIPSVQFQPTNNAQDWQHTNGYVHPGAVDTPVTLIAAVVMPPGVEIVTVRADFYRETSGETAEVVFSRVNAIGGAATLATLTSASTGFHSTSAVVSETVGLNTQYVATLTLQTDASSVDPTDVRCIAFEIEYERGDYTEAY